MKPLIKKYRRPPAVTTMLPQYTVMVIEQKPCQGLAAPASEGVTCWLNIKYCLKAITIKIVHSMITILLY
ncbi:MAG: hypothetical protein U5J62_10555, partial [Desulfurivibrio sp.]|nr:hypothetical protein [Desulfurivibrio sp.]